MMTKRGTLLVGGNGFIGRALASALVRDRREVHVLSRHVAPGRREGIEFHRASQEHAAVVAPLLESCDTVVHLASNTTPGSSARHPMVEIEQDLLPTVRFIDHMTRIPPRHIVFVSSGGCAYGNPTKIPVDESTLPNPLSYHAASKLALESLFSAYAHCNNVSLTIVRPSNVYGPGQTMRHGFGLVRTLMQKALRDEPLEMWGDGEALRDYIYIDDAVSACKALLDSGPTAGVFNVGSGQGTSIREMVRLVERIVGRRINVYTKEARTSDVNAIVLDCTRLSGVTGWRPRTFLEQGIRQTWDWVQSNAE
jgi:UDP-glucose 4-epimerase